MKVDKKVVQELITNKEALLKIGGEVADNSESKGEVEVD